MSGRFAALTNFRNGRNDSFKKSRGDIVRSFISEDYTQNEFAELLDKTADDYNGFNLIFGYPGDLHFFSGITKERRIVQSGIHGLSNGTLNFNWTKVTKAVSAIDKILGKGIGDFENLFDVMRDETPADDEFLPDTGVGIELERILSPIFIRMPSYGTRSTTVLTVDMADNLKFTERTFDESGNGVGDVSIELLLDIKKPAR